MPRTARSLVAKGHYHVINRGNNRATIFHDARDYEAFTALMEQGRAKVGLTVLAACVMPNHFHAVVAQQGPTDISRWMHWLLTTHTHRHHLRYDTCGRLWQGRFKAFPIELDGHLLTVMRYVERNALRAGLVGRAQEWRWGSLAWRQPGSACRLLRLADFNLPADWAEWVNAPQTPDELEAIRACVNRQRPYGGEPWVRDQSALSPGRTTGRPKGRPRKGSPRQVGIFAAPSGGDPGAGKNRRMSPISSAGP